MTEQRFEDLVPDRDYADFFRDEAFRESHPGLLLPPPSFVSSGAKVLSFVSGSHIVLAFPVRPEQANPNGSLQGGILCSFFDDAFGTLSFASLRKPCVSIDMTVNFVRQVRPGEYVRVRAEFIAKSRTLLQCSAEARSGRDKLIATATSNLMVYGSGA